ncbi:hypothetical protein P5673_010476 [Acropora cervicornis]|uniref:Uncharacterized protein n=1 Tax=Acropora cervicornis TaxID=6130 RepID=A0AAD9QQC7_ACRCE|nr:hypothetical protein P5673_010476 [Acropora cervicornis]
MAMRYHNVVMFYGSAQKRSFSRCKDELTYLNLLIGATDQKNLTKKSEKSNKEVQQCVLFFVVVQVPTDRCFSSEEYRWKTRTHPTWAQENISDSSEAVG